MWGAPLSLLWALSAVTLVFGDAYTTAGSHFLSSARVGTMNRIVEKTSPGAEEALYTEDGEQSFVFPGASNKLWQPGLQEPVTHHHHWKDKRGDCIEDDPCPVVCEDGMTCLHKNCSNHSECDGALRCCRTLCGKRCMLPKFKLPCGSDRHCPESTSCCYDGSCDSDCPSQLTTTISQQNSSAQPTVEGSSNPQSSVHSMTQNQSDPQSNVEESNEPHSTTEDSSNALTTKEERNYHK